MITKFGFEREGKTMNDNNLDSRVRRTKRLLRQGLTELLKQKSIKKITVRELSELIDINRGTFYLHYKDIYDNSYESYQKGFSYEVWKTHMDQLLNSIKRRNYNRYTKFCVVHYLYKRMLFQMCLKFDVVHSLLFEYLQSAKGMFVEYLKFHHKN